MRLTPHAFFAIESVELDAGTPDDTGNGPYCCALTTIATELMTIITLEKLEEYSFDGLKDILCPCKLRWEEEVELLDEEKRRIVAFFNWQAKWWIDQSNLHLFVDCEPPTSTGLPSRGRVDWAIQELEDGQSSH
ncbi:hypothetical protein PAXINDRAFT_22314 [Paxillus involutus ATCC 200175]|uniref:Uncharacterized protein n=1 Tax=Paxillus involutus ATCC 200175 TaxID=664439 RepID=A0A0C9SSA2_PAXIN|nr:hypothetical protein PAXINDRAFT_22314 [Paxillus involutus ATCC 200175]